MLKISTKHDEAGKRLSLEVEGRLAGPWVQELERCWEGERSKMPAEAILVRLCAVTFIDDEGKELLTKIVHAGAGLEGSGCMVRAIIARITGARSSLQDCGAGNDVQKTTGVQK
jgi:hypothetical protein